MGWGGGGGGSGHDPNLVMKEGWGISHRAGFAFSRLVTASIHTFGGQTLGLQLLTGHVLVNGPTMPEFA